MKNQVSLFGLATTVNLMREAQKRYFLNIAKAKKTKIAEDFKEANDALKLSKEAEQIVDNAVKEVLDTPEPKLNLSERARVIGELQLIVINAGVDKVYYLNLAEELRGNYQKAQEVENA